MLSLNIPTFIYVILNLAFLYIVLKKVLFKPVTEFMEEREKSIKNTINNANMKLTEAEEKKNAFENQLRSAYVQADNILLESRQRGEKEFESLLQEAKSMAENILEKGKAEIDRERALMLKEIRNQVASLALAAASKVVEANMDNEKNRAIVDKILDEAGAA